MAPANTIYKRNTVKYDFDKFADRQNTNSIKYDFAKGSGKPEGLLPMWIADMDFPAPPEVLADLEKTVSHGIFGYTDVKDDYYNAVSDWFGQRFGFHVTKDEIIKTPGVVFAIACAIRAYTKESGSVMVQTPVYYPFFSAIRDNGRKLIINQLIYKDGKYTIDFDDFEKKAKEHKVELFILCSPHNPVGRVWTKQELETLNDICTSYGIIIISDEIHCDFIYGGSSHTVFGRLNESAVICTAPSKTFNLAGLQVSNIFIKDAGLRRKIELEIRRSAYSQLNTVGLAACKSAYLHGGEWLRQLIDYLSANISLVRNFLQERLPCIKLIEPQGTYLLWLDFRELGLSQAELDNFLIQKAKLLLSSGTSFGENGGGFQRLNIACPRALLQKALDQLECSLT